MVKDAMKGQAMDHVECAVVGGGIAGLLAALAVARQGRSVALIAPMSSSEDGRTTALMDQSVELVRSLGLWSEIEPIAAPLSAMRIIDGTDRLFRAPTVTFHAIDIGLDAFGYNVPNAKLTAILDATIAEQPAILRKFARFSSLSTDGDAATIVLDDGSTVSAGLILGADGKRSAVREASGIAVRTWSYPQTAVVLNMSHQRAHQNISTEFHTGGGPFTQVPLPGDRSSLVWVQKPDDAEATAALSGDALALAIERRMQSMLGRITVETAAQTFALSGMTARHFGRGRIVLIGEAAHAFPPIGAQGLNLSLRDVATVTSMLDDDATVAPPADFGDRYDAKRRVDILSRTASVDLLNRSLLSGFIPVQLLRAGGLQALASVAPLRNLLMREGLYPGSALRDLAGALRDRIGRQSA